MVNKVVKKRILGGMAVLLGVAAVLFAVQMPATAKVQAANKVEKIGTTYPIKEPHAIKAIQEALLAKQANGDLAKWQADAEARVRQSMLTPKPVDWLATATKNDVRYFEPTYTVPATVYDHEGRIIAPAGTVIKPLEVAPIPFKLFFFDGRDEAQIKIAEKLSVEHGENFLPILTAGEWETLSYRIGRAVYFDQEGRMSKSFQLTSVPSLVSQQGMMIRVEVMKP